MKQCFKCKEVKPLDAFYKHPNMPDGHVNKCKECNKKDVIANRLIKVDYYRAYDAARGPRHQPGENQMVRERFPMKYRARNAVNNAVRNGKLIKQPCEVCGRTKDIHGHHDDYSKPLEVRWLCPPHHKAWHLEHGEAPNMIK